MDSKQVGRKIRDLRKKRGQSQEELGRVLDKSHAAVSDIERGKTDIGISDLTAIAKTFGTTVSEMLAEEPQITPVSAIHYRDSKDITPEEKRAADKMGEEFIKLARELKAKPDAPR